MEQPGEREQPPPQPWGRLVRLGSGEGEPPVLLRKPQWTIGRRRGCDLSFPGNKLVSGDHCKITVDEKSGQVSLEDTSTNGTVINKLKIVKKQTCPLQTGDTIYLVYRKNEPEHSVAYLYESLSEKRGVTQDSSEANKENVFHVTNDTSGAGRGDEPQALPSAPTSQACFEEPQPSTSMSDLVPSASTSSVEPTAGRAPPSGSASRGITVSLKGCGPSEARDAISSVPSVLPDAQGTPSCLLEPQDQENSEPVHKRMRGDGEPNLNLHLLVTDQCDPHPALEDIPAPALKPDKMEETLTCIICQDLLHDCVSLQPCMHTFCAACYSGWMERSSLCPTCRCPVERICKNHILNNLVEAYLLQHPDKSRSEEDVQGMAARNKITQDMLQPRVRRSFSDEEGSSEELLELSDVDSVSSDVSSPSIRPENTSAQCGPEHHSPGDVMPRQGVGEGRPRTPGTAEGARVLEAAQERSWEVAEQHLLSAAISGQPYIVCRQCPEHRRLSGPGSEQEPPRDTLAASASVTTGQDYVCPLQGSHAMCSCCFQPMPDRRAEREQDPGIAPQQCSVCLQPFCHLYWGCSRSGCLGCLAPFCELNLGDRCLDGVLSNNNYESDIFKSYLAARGLTWKSVLTESLVALQRGTFLLSDYRITGNSVLCYCCGLRSFRELTYQYRQNIPASELPVAVTSRPDCYWGRNCRTQVKAHHAMKFNHICEQTRFKN